MHANNDDNYNNIKAKVFHYVRNLRNFMLNQSLVIKI